MHLMETLRHEGVRDEKVLDAMSKVPRHLFLEKAFEEWAYKNVAFPIGCEQTISQPLTVAIQTGLLEIKKEIRFSRLGPVLVTVHVSYPYLERKYIRSSVRVHCMKKQTNCSERLDLALYVHFLEMAMQGYQCSLPLIKYSLQQERPCCPKH